ncbi:hypothetical protein [Streptomyces sp. SAS_270]|uniref:hypothetical protein n=1 Tax=Streptomyces sp. SAS_270 TaxID=3412748 RepID=UPI00403D0A65
MSAKSALSRRRSLYPRLFLLGIALLCTGLITLYANNHSSPANNGGNGSSGGTTCGSGDRSCATPTTPTESSLPTTQQPTDGQTDRTEEPTDDPTDEPTDDPTDEPTSSPTHGPDGNAPNPQAGSASDMVNALGALTSGVGTLLTGAAAVLMARRERNSRTPVAPPPAEPATSPQGEGNG